MSTAWDHHDDATCDNVELTEEQKRDAAAYICNAVSDVAERVELLRALDLEDYVEPV